MKDKDMGIELTLSAKRALAAKGYDPVLGARPLRRALQREIEDPLSEKILFGELSAGQIVRVDAEGDGEAAVFTFEGVDKDDIVEEPVAAGAASAEAAPAAEATGSAS